MLSVAECWSEEPTLARLSFWVPRERMAEFEAVYQEKVVPILKKHGLVESSERGRATIVSSSNMALLMYLSVAKSLSV